MNGMSTVEKSMEKTKFYNREDLKAKDVVRLIGIWEGEAGESFTDYCDFSREADKNFLLFLAEKYPILYDYHCKVAGNDWLDHCIQYVVDHCGEYLTQWVPAEGMLIDEPITPILELIRNFCDNYPAKLIILTGREDTPEIRKATEEWLENNFLHPDILLMRPAKSFIAGPVCKKKLYEDNVKGKFYIPFVLEDNAKCVAMWRDEGLICLQPNEGKF